MDRYAREVAEYEQSEQQRMDRLARREAEYERLETEARRSADERVARISVGIREGDESSIEEFAATVISALPMPDGLDLRPAVAYRSDPREIVVDIRLPPADIVPVEKTIKYVRARSSYTVKDRSRTERETIYRAVLAQLPLSVMNSLFVAFDNETMESATVNGILHLVDRATGRPATRYMVSVTTSRSSFDGLVLNAPELDPVLCIRELEAKLSPHPLDYEKVPTFLTFDEAKYRLGPSIDVAAGLDGRANLLEIDWSDFEQLVRELLLKMANGQARVTRRSRDDGIDGVIFDCDAALGGEYIVQAKRYRNVVPANDVRALAGVMRLIHGLRMRFYFAACRNRRQPAC